MIEFDGNPFEIAPIASSVSNTTSFLSRIPTWVWYIIVGIGVVIIYHLFCEYQRKKKEKKE